MALTPDQQKRILEALAAKTENAMAPGSGCPFCGQHLWTLNVGGFVPIVVHDSPTAHIPGVTDRYMPTATFICNTCGNVQFVNLRILGLVDIAEGTDTQEVPPPPVLPILGKS